MIRKSHFVSLIEDVARYSGKSRRESLLMVSESLRFLHIIKNLGQGLNYKAIDNEADNLSIPVYRRQSFAKWCLDNVR